MSAGFLPNLANPGRLGFCSVPGGFGSGERFRPAWASTGGRPAPRFRLPTHGQGGPASPAVGRFRTGPPGVAPFPVPVSAPPRRRAAADDHLSAPGPGADRPGWRPPPMAAVRERDREPGGPLPCQGGGPNRRNRQRPARRSGRTPPPGSGSAGRAGSWSVTRPVPGPDRPGPTSGAPEPGLFGPGSFFSISDIIRIRILGISGNAGKGRFCAPDGKSEYHPPAPGKRLKTGGSVRMTTRL